MPFMPWHSTVKEAQMRQSVILFMSERFLGLIYFTKLIKVREGGGIFESELWYRCSFQTYFKNHWYSSSREVSKRDRLKKRKKIALQVSKPWSGSWGSDCSEYQEPVVTLVKSLGKKPSHSLIGSVSVRGPQEHDCCKSYWLKKTYEEK